MKADKKTKCTYEHIIKSKKPMQLWRVVEEFRKDEKSVNYKTWLKT
jgi:hypothetical protein